jgi:DNA-binding NarL/FixJ family response regulator
MIRVILTDDHLLVRKGLRQLLEDQEDLQVVAEAGDAAELLACLGSTPCDVLLLDLSLPGRSGLDVLRQLRTDYPRLAVLVVSMYAEQQYAVRAVRGGAAGYLSKESAPEQLVAAIRRAHAGGTVVSDELALQLATALTRPEDAPPHLRLSDREFQILRLIAAGYSLTAIGAKMHISIKTVSTYRSRLLDKLGMQDNVELTAYVLQNGLGEGG